MRHIRQQLNKNPPSVCWRKIPRTCCTYAFRQKKKGKKEKKKKCSKYKHPSSDATLPLFAGATKKALVCLHVDSPLVRQLYNHTPLSGTGRHCGGCRRCTCGRVSLSAACPFSTLPRLLAWMSPTQQWAVVSARPSAASLSLHSSPNCLLCLCLLCSSSAQRARLHLRTPLPTSLLLREFSEPSYYPIDKWTFAVARHESAEIPLFGQRQKLLPDTFEKLAACHCCLWSRIWLVFMKLSFYFFREAQSLGTASTWNAYTQQKEFVLFLINDNRWLYVTC